MCKFSKVRTLAAVIVITIISTMVVSCVTLKPNSIAKSDDGFVMVVESAKIDKTLGNWGIKNKFKYVAYKTLGAGSTTQINVYGNQYSAYGTARTVSYSKVSVIGLNNADEVPPDYTVVEVTGKIYREMTQLTAYLSALGAGLCLVGILFFIIY